MNEKKETMKPKKESFKLSKVKLVKDGGLDVHFEVEEVLGSEVYTDKYHKESSKDMHPDLTACFVNLKPVMARIFHLTFFREVLANKEFKATPKQSAYAEKMYQEILNKITVTGIALSGQDTNEGVVITGTFKADTNQVMAINSHRIKFTDTKYGFEEDLELTVDEIKEEVFKFLFEGKRAQLDLFAQAEEDKKEENELPFDGKAAAAGMDKDDDFEPELNENIEDKEEEE